VVLAVALGGVGGADARYGLARALPHSSAQFPWSTLLINVSGCLVIGGLLVTLLSWARPPRLARPFLGVGVLGGYTTYSTFATDTVGLVVRHHAGLAVGYLAATVLGCAVAVWVGATAAAAIRPPPRPADERR
jgi:fluoride exporter